jgi:hypothetical protein
MAGICEAGGLTVVDGKLELSGPPELAWPGPCTIEEGNALRIDPGTGKVWAPQALVRRKTTTGDTITAAVTVSGTYPLGDDLVHTQTAPSCAPYDVRFIATLSGGYFGQRMGTGNWWAVRRFVTIYVNGVVVAFTGLQTVAGLENNSGGVLGAGGAVDPLTITAPVPAGQVVKVVASYEHQRLAFTANPANSYEWRPPVIDGFMFALET